MTRHSTSSFVLLGALASGCGGSTFDSNGNVGGSSSTGSVQSGGASTADGTPLAGTTHAGGSIQGSTPLPSGGTANTAWSTAASATSGGTTATGGTSKGGGTAQLGGGASNLGGTGQVGGTSNGGGPSSSAGTTAIDNPAGGLAGSSVGGGTTGGNTPIGGVTSAGGAYTFGGSTSASGGAATAGAGGQQTTGGTSATTITSPGCGNGQLDAAEQCDDGNQVSADGCSSTCQVEIGWHCRKVGHYCAPICGDEKMVGSETCDDGNKDNGDGCSSTCSTEPGYECIGTGAGSCRASICGDGVIQRGEACDCGDDPNNLPLGCAGPNGLFFGDGSGCSKTCTKEPICQRNDKAGCASVCGDGNVTGNENCDDGNTLDGDGCKGDCSGTEDGFNCNNVDISDAQDCPSNPSLKCLVLPVIYRDFEGQNVAGGHPDFFYMGAAATGGRTVGVPAGSNKTTCVPNAYGTLAAFGSGGSCPANDQAGPCTGLVADTLDSEGKPVMAKQKCHCVFTDWDNTGVLGDCSGAECTPDASLSNVATCYLDGSGDYHLRVEADVDMFQSADSFKQWYRDSNFSKKVFGSLEMAATSGGLYQFSSSRPGDPAGSSSRVRFDDLHDACLASPHSATLDTGFFPLEDEASTKICNITSYWMAGVATASDATCCAGPGCPVKAQFDPLASWDNCPTEGVGGMVPSSDGTGGKITGKKRNYYFTTEVRYLFRYDGKAATLSFNRDDDVWAFINGILAIDLGGTHERASKDVSVTGSTYKLIAGNTYQIAVFHAQRTPVDSDFQLTLSGFSTKRTVCGADCGDGKATAAEECDLGRDKNTGAYDGCKSDCTYGPFCGDGLINGPEECDDGANLTLTYDPSHPDACHPGCSWPPK